MSLLLGLVCYSDCVVATLLLPLQDGHIHGHSRLCQANKPTKWLSLHLTCTVSPCVLFAAQKLW